MKKNVGKKEGFSRILIGLGVIFTGLMGYIGIVSLAFGPFPQALTSITVAIIGLLIILTGVTRRSLVNKLLGRDTS